MFVRVVDEGSFSAAGRALGLVPSTVSKQISRLEDRLGSRLLSRSTRRIHLTEAGQAFYVRCAAILADIDDAERSISEMSGVPRGTLRVSGTVGFTKSQVIPRLHRFLSRYPELQIEFDLSDRVVDLLAKGYDLALRIGTLEGSSLVARKLASNRRVVCAAPAYLERHGAPQRPSELCEHNCLILTTSTSFNEWEFNTDEGPRVIRVSGNFRVNHGDALHQALLAGIGLARIAVWLVGPDIEAGRLIRVLPNHEQESTAVYAIYPHRRHLAPKVRAFVDFLAEELAAEPWSKIGKGPIE
ncbi:MAG: LysR family transcriptional regulator [Proteobacteria bacterium]|nr:LysR family transcriptional regulator [Pseudomonadota bacterium]